MIINVISDNEFTFFLDESNSGNLFFLSDRGLLGVYFYLIKDNFIVLIYIFFKI